MRFIVSRSRTRLSVRKFLFLCTLFFFTTVALLLLLNLTSSIDPPTTAFSLPPKALPESLHPLDPLKPNPSSPIHRRSPVQSSCATVEEMGEDASSEVATRKESLRVRRIIRHHFEFHGAPTVRGLPPEQFCRHGFVLGKASEAGFGNEMYKILTAAGLSIMLNRSLVIGQTRHIGENCHLRVIFLTPTLLLH